MHNDNRPNDPGQISPGRKPPRDPVAVFGELVEALDRRDYGIARRAQKELMIAGFSVSIRAFRFAGGPRR